MSLLDRIRDCQRWERSRYRPFSIAGQTLGWVTHDFARRIAAFPEVFRVSADSVDLSGGARTDVQLALSRWENMAQRGWFSGDAHIHGNYTAPDHQIITPEDILLQMTAEDLNNANLMVANSWNDYVHDEKFFEGSIKQLARRKP